jgi:hypothetical protein
MGVQYLNTDVEVRAPFDLFPLRQALGEPILDLFCGETEPGRFLLSFELAGLSGEQPEETANALCEIIESLSGNAREIWNTATDRVFDVGYDAVADSHCGQFTLSPEILMRIARLNARLGISIYTIEPESH